MGHRHCGRLDEVAVVDVPSFHFLEAGVVGVRVGVGEGNEEEES